MPKEHVVADGRDRLLSDPGFQAEIDRAVAEIEDRYAPLIAAASPLRRQWLRWRMRCEIVREVERRAPAGGLYARAQ